MNLPPGQLGENGRSVAISLFSSTEWYPELQGVGRFFKNYLLNFDYPAQHCEKKAPPLGTNPAMSLPVSIAGLLCGASIVLAYSTPIVHSREPVASAIQTLPDPEVWFITQNQHPKYHPEPTTPYNANCGPAALAMALRAFGLAPPGLGSAALIRYARRLMTGSEQAGTWTYPDQILAAARRAGLEAQEVRGIHGILGAISRPGHLVVANLNPGGIYDHLLSEPYQGGHFTVVVGERDMELVLNDPLAERPALTVSVKAFEKALLADLAPGKPAYDGGIEIWLPEHARQRAARTSHAPTSFPVGISWSKGADRPADL